MTGQIITSIFLFKLGKSKDNKKFYLIFLLICSKNTEIFPEAFASKSNIISNTTVLLNISNIPIGTYSTDLTFKVKIIHWITKD